MQGWPTGFWGKFQPPQPSAGPQWHPLTHHCADVAACFQALLNLPLLRRRLAQLGGLDDLDWVQQERLSALAFIHDLGKLSIGFQYKILEHNPFPPQHRGHADVVLALFSADATLRERASKVLGLPAMVGWAHEDTVMRLLLASISHHGRPVLDDLGGDLRAAAAWRPHQHLDPLQGLEDLIGASRRCFPAAYEPGGSPLPAAAPFQHGFAGLVMLADWLGSNRAWFPYSESEDAERWPFAQDRARKALLRIGLNVAPARAALQRLGTDFGRLFPKISEPNPMQRAVGALPLATGPSLTILESETGSGKTEAALWHYLRLMEAGLVDSLYFALPTRTSATQIHARVHEAVQSAFGDDAPPVVLAVPGLARVDGADPATLLPSADERWSDDPQDLQRERGWAAEHPKRFTGAAIAVGTIDQALLAALQVKHAHLRGAGLLRSLLVVDEVHASDPYMERLLRQLLRVHDSAGGYALLMSATLGSRSRAAFLGTPLSPLFDAVRLDYPLLLTRPEGGAPEIRRLGSTRSKTVRLEPLPILADAAEIARQALLAAKAGARVLVLRNTVRSAVDTQLALEALAGAAEPLLFRCGTTVTLHHARFAREDRQILDDALQAAFGKEGIATAGVVVATQTVQQSLDVDFDLLFTDLCPIDVLLQRAGRLHRHPDRQRPPGFEAATCRVLAPAARDLTPFLHRSEHGLGSVYADLRVIEATWRLIEGEGHITIPADNRRLVEHATHPEALEAVATALGGPWLQHGQEMEGERLGSQTAAQLNALDWSVPFGDRRNAFPSGLDRRIATRLGTDDRMATFPKRIPGAFGRPVQEIRLPGHLCPGIPPDAEARVVESEPRVVFTFGKWRFAYDRLGLQRVQG